MLMQNMTRLLEGLVFVRLTGQNLMLVKADFQLYVTSLATQLEVRQSEVTTCL